MKISKTFIYALAVVIVYLVYKRFGKSNYTSGSKEISIGDVQNMMNSGMAEAKILESLIKSGLTTEVAQQMMLNARFK